VGGGYFLVALISPAAIGLGDVYVAAIGSGLLGWASWRHVVAGQVLIWLLGPVALAAVAVARPATRGLRMAVPMGPALIVGALAATWL
jgi:leader peptidase (prepilin peptidase)/N-methyltransferase